MGSLEALAAVGGGPDHLDVVLEAEELLEVVARAGDVVDDEQADHGGLQCVLDQATDIRDAAAGSTVTPGPMVAASVTFFT